MTRQHRAQARRQRDRERNRRHLHMVGGWTLDLVEARFDCPRGCLAKPGRGSTSHILARQVAGYLMSTRVGLAYTEAARILGRHDSTVAHAVRVVEGLREDPGLNARIAELEKAVDALRSAVEPEAVA